MNPNPNLPVPFRNEIVMNSRDLEVISIRPPVGIRDAQHVHGWAVRPTHGPAGSQIF